MVVERRSQLPEEVCSAPNSPTIMRKNLIPLLDMALVIAGLCTVIFYGMVADRFSPSPAGAQAAPTQMVVAAKTLDRGRVLESADLKVVEGVCPLKTQPGCFSSVSPLLGRTTVEAVVEAQPFTEDVIAKRTAGGGPSAAIPVGMRAVTLHAADSSGVVKMIRSGDRIDLQVIGSADPQSLRLSVQKVWENIEVLNAQPPDPGSPHVGRPVLTVLLPPADAERLSLADTTSRIRVVLRNRQESVAAAAADQHVPLRAANTHAAANDSPSSTSTKPTPPAAVPATAVPAEPARPSFLVRLVSVHPDQLTGLGADASAMQPLVSSVSRGNLEQTLARLEQDKTAHILSSRPLALSGHRETAVALGADGERLAALVPGLAGVRLRMQSLDHERWRIEPEAQTGARGAAAARRAETEVSLGQNQAWLVSGLLEHKGGRPVLPGQGGEKEPRLLLLITPVQP